MSCSLQLLAQVVISGDIGFWFFPKGQSQRWIKVRRCNGSVIHQAMQKIQHMGFGRHTGLKRHFDGGQDIMLVMLQHQRQDLSHFPVSAALLEQMLLKQPEGFWPLGKRGAVA